MTEAPSRSTRVERCLPRSAKVVNWLFRNRQTGKITIAQFPNLPLSITLAAIVVQRAAGNGTVLDSVADRTAGIALGWWGIDEIARGVNPWRRILGMAGVAFAALRLAHSL